MLNGLTSEQARSRLKEVGPNDPAPVHRTTALTHLLHSFANPLVVILLVASGISAAVGELLNAAIIFVMVLLGIIILAAFDILAIRRYGLRQYRQIQADRREMIQEEVARIRGQRNGFR